MIFQSIKKLELSSCVQGTDRATFCKRLIYIILIIIGLVLNSYGIFLYCTVPGSDFEQDYIAASNLFEGLSIYQGVNAHPPFNALFFYPLTFFPLQVAFVLIGALSLSLLCINALMIENGLILKNTSAYVIFALSLLWPVTMAVVCLGQSSIIWAGAITAGWLFEKKEKPIFAGIFIGIAILIKLIPALIVIMWCLNRRWRATLSATIVVLVGFILMIWLIGFDDILYFFFTRVPENARYFIDYYGNTSISGAAEKLFGSNGGWSKSLAEIPMLSKGISVFGSVAIVLATMIIIKHKSSKTVKDIDDYHMALVIVTILLVSPLTWPHYYLVLLFPLTLLLNASDNVNSILIQSKIGVLVSICLLILPTCVEVLSGQNVDFWTQQPTVIQLITLSQTIALFMLWSLIANKVILLNSVRVVEVV